MSDWISVEDEIPEEGAKVLVAISTGPKPTDWDVAVMWRYQHWRWDGYGRSIPDGGDPEYPLEQVTHWRPLGIHAFPDKP